MGILDNLKSEIKSFVPKANKKASSNDKSEAGLFVKALKAQVKYIDFIAENNLETGNNPETENSIDIEKLNKKIAEYNKNYSKKSDHQKVVKSENNLWFKKEENKEGNMVYSTRIKIGVSWYNIFPDNLVDKDGKPLPGDKAYIAGNEHISSIKDLYEKLIEAAKDGEFNDFIAKIKAGQSTKQKPGPKPKDTNTDLSVTENTATITESADGNETTDTKPTTEKA